MNGSNEWSTLEAEILSCRKCRLHNNRRNPVPGEGNKLSPVIFIGEAPGEREDESGRPFVGPAGVLLTELIEAIGYKRSDFYITNIVKCRPPSNRDPEDDEIEACLPYLLKQLELIKPQIIIALGRHAARTLFKLSSLKWSSMMTQHGKVYTASLMGREVRIVPTYHPASALYRPHLKKELEKDFKQVIKPLVDEAFGRRARGPRPVTLLDFVSASTLESTEKPKEPPL